MMIWNSKNFQGKCGFARSQLIVSRVGAELRRTIAVTRRPIIIADPSIDQHPALEAWNRRESTGDKLATLEVWRNIKNLHGYKSLVYRLVFRNGGRPAVFAKQRQAGGGNEERLFYEEILPDLRLPPPADYGSVGGADGDCWVLLEAGGPLRL